MRVAIVHYHAKRGGVTRVMENALNALSSAYRTIDAVVLTGEKSGEDCQLPVQVVPNLGYLRSGDRVSGVQLADAMESSARDFLGVSPDLWHVHNPSLGKNPVIMDALIELARRGHRLLLQIHDFAEDGRPGNYRLRQKNLESISAYPLADQVHYAVLNRRDYQILFNAGIPEDQLHWLPNPVIARELDPSELGEFSSGMDELVVYPVRAVRRKNLGELLLHAALPSKRRAFVTTLGTTSEDFRSEYLQWENFALELGLQVSFEVAQRFDLSFDAIMDSATNVITTSVAEGYGLGFLEPWLFGKTLIGRDLPEITADFKELGIEFNRLYQSLPIPLSVFRLDEFRSRLQSMIKSFLERYGIEADPSWMDQWIAHSVKDQQIDFALLDEVAQREVIESVQSSPLLQQDLASIIHYGSEEDAVINRNASIIETELNLKKYGLRLKALYNHLVAVEPGELEFADDGKVLAAFLSVERFVPLRS